MLLKDYMNYWYFTYKYPKQSLSTRFIVRSMLKNHIANSKLGNMEINEIKTKDIQIFLTELIFHGNKNNIQSINSFKKPLSSWTIRKIRQYLISIFKLAVNEDIVKKNYASDTEPIALSYKESPVFTEEQEKKILKKTKNDRFYLAYLLLFLTGCRRGEILGLSWTNVNFEKKYIYIKQTLIMVNGKIILQEKAKTIHSIRIIPLPKEIMDLLAKHRIKQEKEKRATVKYNNENNLVFVNKDGSFYNPKYFSRNFKNNIIKIGLPKELHLHSTRHTWATNMIHCNVPITDIQALGGWSRPDVLLNIYSHTLQKNQIIAIDTLYNKKYKSI